MRIIGGRLKGRTISPPPGYKARPTTDFAREGLFNVLGNEYELEDITVLDLFGGTGAISFEFASRGASEVCCVEMAPANASFIRSQAGALGLRNVSVVRHNVFDFIRICTRSYDIVFADPPYAMEGLDTLPDRVLGAGLVVEDGYFILEHPAEHSFSGHPRFVKERKYGNVHFSFFLGARREESGEQSHITSDVRAADDAGSDDMTSDLC